MMIKAQLQDSGNRQAELELQADTANQRAHAAETRLTVAEQQSAASAGQAVLLHDRIIAAFKPIADGVGGAL
jgi:hypothetical protein